MLFCMIAILYKSHMTDQWPVSNNLRPIRLDLVNNFELQFIDSNNVLDLPVFPVGPLLIPVFFWFYLKVMGILRVSPCTAIPPLLNPCSFLLLAGSSTLVGVSSSLCWMPATQTQLLKQRKWSPSTVQPSASGPTPLWQEYCRHTDLNQETTQTVCQHKQFFPFTS